MRSHVSRLESFRRMSKITCMVITDKKAWDGFVAAQPGSQFLQSWDWGEFKKSQGHEVVRLAMADASGAWQIAGQFIFHSKRLFGGFWFSPRGPIVVHSRLDDADALLKDFTDQSVAYLTSLKKGMFVRCEPAIEFKIDSTPLPKGFVRRPSISPSSTVVIGLEQSEEELMGDMHEKTRYNIRLAERKGVTVRTGSTDADIEVFLALNRETASRDGFLSQTDAYIKATVQALRISGMCRIRIAEYQGMPLAANIEISFGDTMTYVYGASSSAHRNAMAPLALQWSAIRDAKREGYRFYDLYGCNPSMPTSYDYKKSWEGITRFKMGFGGSRVEFVGTWELPLMPFAYRVMKMVRGY